VWEAAQPDGSVIGIDLSTVQASVPDAVVPEGTPMQLGSRLQVGVFQRLQEKMACGEENFFVVAWTGPGSSDGLVSYANGKLEIHYFDHVSHSEIHVELVLDPVKDVWTGHFHRKGFDGQVILHRTSDRPDPAQGGCFISSSSIAQIPKDCDKPELLVNGRPSMVPVGANLAFGVSMTEHEFKTGDPIKLHVRVDNSGDEPVGVLTCLDLERFKAQGFDLFDQNGHQLLNRQDAKVAEECKTNPRGANFHRGVWICNRNFPITIPAHTCVTRDDYDFTTVLASGYDLPPGEYTLRLRTNWRIADDLCEQHSGEPVHLRAGEITFSVIQP
jgi:hypothetical protein